MTLKIFAPHLHAVDVSVEMIQRKAGIYAGACLAAATVEKGRGLTLEIAISWSLSVPPFKGRNEVAEPPALAQPTSIPAVSYAMPPDDSRQGLPQAFAAGTHLVPHSRVGSSDSPFERFPEEFEPGPSLAERNRSATTSRRDFNLIRLILIEAEQPGKHLFRYDQFNRHMVQNHLFMLIEAGLLEGSVVRDANGLIHAEVERLTWAGHDLLAQVRDQARWQKAQAAVLDANGRAHLGTLLHYLSTQ